MQATVDAVSGVLRQLTEHPEEPRELRADLVAKYAAAGIAPRPEVGIANDAAIEIVRIAEHEKADLVVMATHGTSGWNRLIFGSVADKVVRLAKCSVLLIRAPS